MRDGHCTATTTPPITQATAAGACVMAAVAVTG